MWLFDNSIGLWCELWSFLDQLAYERSSGTPCDTRDRFADGTGGQTTDRSTNWLDYVALVRSCCRFDWRKPRTGEDALAEREWWFWLYESRRRRGTSGPLVG
jgi:hypothetical protein